MKRNSIAALGGVLIVGSAAAVTVGLGPVSGASAADQPAVKTHGGALIVRDAPSKSGNEVRRISNGKPVKIECQTNGDLINDGYFAPTTLWDRIGTNEYVSDAFVRTGRNGMVADQCPGPAAAAAPSRDPVANQEQHDAPLSPGPNHWLTRQGEDDLRDTDYARELDASVQHNLLGLPKNARFNEAILRVDDVSVGGWGVSALIPKGTVDIYAFGTGTHVTGVVGYFRTVNVTCNWQINLRFTPVLPEQGAEENDKGVLRGCDRTGKRVMRYDRDLPAGRMCADLVVDARFVEAACVSITP